jgi:GntR family transcriptional regulator/MocR family aminotransferase
MSRSNSVNSEQTNSPAGFSSDLLLALDRSGRSDPLSRQLQRQLRRAIQQGRIAPSTLLPPTRLLAQDLGVARSVVVDAYAQLTADGYLDTRQGSGTRVRATAITEATHQSRAESSSPTVYLAGGLPDPALFPRTEWVRAYRRAMDTLPKDQLGYSGARGVLRLREVLSDYLGRVRGVSSDPDRLVITSGLTQALVLLCRALRAHGVKEIAVEDPCFGFHREAIVKVGLRPVPIPIDVDGLDVSQLARYDVGAVLLSPAHSYPMGSVLSASRRVALIEWARRRDGLIVEDDYDAEFRYDRAPIGALQGLAPEHVAYAGCASKTLAPALRLGWIALPGWLVDAVGHQKLFDDVGTTSLEQSALAEFIDIGAFTRHLRRVRPIYRRRRDAALESLAACLPGAKPTGVAAGLHMYVQLPQGSNEEKLADAARERGILLEGAKWHWSAPESAPPALVLGYGALHERAMRKALSVVGSVYRSQR